MTTRAATTDTIFISYSRRDREAVKKLYAELEALGFKLWRDLPDIEGGEPFWEEIKKAIDACQTVVLCMSPDSLKSEFVQKEWHYARQQGKRVIPVVVAPINFDTLPRWMGRVDWKDFREGVAERETVWASFIKTLNTPYTGRKVPFMAPRLPEYFVQRPEKFDKLKQALIREGGAVAITAAIEGAGGYGKTTLAMALCADNGVLGAFDDGVLWVTLGEKPSESDLIRKASDLITLMTGEAVAVTTREAVQAELAKAIGDRYILLVIDDLWRKSDGEFFMVGGPHTGVLITTRYPQYLPNSTGFHQDVDTMETAESIALLTWNIAGVGSEDQQKLAALADRVGNWAVLLRLVNAQLRGRISKNETLVAALVHVDKALTRKGLTAFDDKNDPERQAAVKSTVEASLDLLTSDQKAQFAHLAIFPEDAEIPFTTLEKLWGLDDFDTDGLAGALSNAGLLLNFALDSRSLRLHDVMRQYLIDEHRAEMVAWQSEFIGALELMALPDDYCWRNIAYHLLAAGRTDTLRGLLLNLDWLEEKLDQTEAAALIADCADYLKARGGEEIFLLESALSMSAHILKEDKGQLHHQLRGRLWMHREKPGVAELWAQMEGRSPFELLAGQTYPPMSQAGGPLRATLRGHTDRVSGALVLPDGRLLSWSDREKTLRLWSGEGAALSELRGHTDRVSGALVLPDGRLLSWAEYENTLRLWSGEGAALGELRGHTEPVRGALVLPDGRLLSWSGEYRSNDNTLRLWSGEGAALGELRGHTDRVSGALVLPDGRLLSWAGEYESTDHTLRLWSGEGAALGELRGHTGPVIGARVLPDGRLLSWSDDYSLRLWSGEGAALGELRGHTGPVRGALVLPDGRLLSWAGGAFSSDHTLRLWSGEGAALGELRGHTDWVRGALVLPDGRLLSWSEDKTLRLWSGEGAALGELRGHTHWVIGALVLPDGRLLSWGRDATLRLWSGEGAALGELRGHTWSVEGALVLPDGRLLSWSLDATLRLWSGEGAALGELRGHTGPVEGALVLPDGRLLSWSEDKTLRLWSGEGAALGELRGHTHWVRGARVLPDGRLLSWGADATLRLWSGEGEPLGVLEKLNWSDRAGIMAWGRGYGADLAVLFDDIDDTSSPRFGQEGDRLHLYDPQSHSLLATFYADAPIEVIQELAEGRVAYGDRYGRVVFLGWRPAGLGGPPTRAVQIEVSEGGWWAVAMLMYQRGARVFRVGPWPLATGRWGGTCSSDRLPKP